ncbi:MAG TPA: hypothetical protein VK465_08335 [Fibrobacteria bacterium]|nr:hypothetical protein [Fibrobacteria bacterium]
MIRDILFLAASLGLHAVHAASCLGDSVGLRNLPHTLGKPYDNLKNPLYLPCDTMVVAAGDTSTLNPGSMLHFGPRASEKHIILVEGTLIARGGDQEPVYFSGTITESAFGLRPGTGRWGGFRVAPGGELRISDAVIVNAEYAVESESEEVTVSKTLLKGCSYLRGPGNSLPIDIRGTDVKYWDLGAPKVSSVEPSAPALKKSTTLGWTLVGVAALAAVSGGAWYWLAQDDAGDAHHGPTPQGPDYSGRPDMPSGQRVQE